MLKGLKWAFKACCVTPQMPTQMGGTRWLPHTFVAIFKHLQGNKVLPGDS